MHNIDRTQLEFEFEMEDFEGEPHQAGEYDEILPEAEQLELAAELLEVRDEHELDQFLGHVICRVGGSLGRGVRPPNGQAIGGVLKGIAGHLLPMASDAIGSLAGGPLGSQIGSAFSSLASSVLGLEAEFEHPEDAELEGAKHFIRIAADTFQKSTEEPADPDPRVAAQQALMQSVHTLAPALLHGDEGPDAGMYVGHEHHRHHQHHHHHEPHRHRRHQHHHHRGHWVRRGNKIILFGV